MSILAAILIASQATPTANVQIAPYNPYDCRTLFMPMNFETLRSLPDRRAKGKARPPQKQPPVLRPCLTRASG